MIETAEEFVRLRSSQDPADYGRAANEPAPLAVWLEIVERFPNMRAWVAHNKTAPLEVLRLLAEAADPEVRSAVGMKRKLDRVLFELLAADVDPEVRTRVAYNAKTPLDLIQKLSNDPEDLVREAASSRLQGGESRGD